MKTTKKIVLTMTAILSGATALAMDIASLENMKNELQQAKVSVQDAINQIKNNHSKLKNDMVGQLNNAIGQINNQEAQLQSSIDKVKGLPAIALDLALIQDLPTTLQSMITGPLATIKNSLTALQNNIITVANTMDPEQDPQKFYQQANQAIEYFDAAIIDLQKFIDALKEI